jgi:RecB family exonuclease
MKKADKPRPVTAYSHSRIACYETCPAQFKYRNILKLPEQKSPQMLRGQQAHELLEAHVRAPRATRLPNEFSHLRAELARARKAGAIPERKLAFSKDWELLGWFDPPVRLRVGIDLWWPLKPRAVRLVDYKTGRAKPEEHTDQLGLYALAAFMVDPALETVETRPWYVDHHPRPVILSLFDRSHVAGLLARWTRRGEATIADRKYAATPSSRACGWCPFSKFRGGPCVSAAA